MKEATGELSMTAIVVVIIGVIAVAAPPIVRNVINSTGGKAKCMAAYACVHKGGTANKADGVYECQYLEDGAEKGTPITCSGKDLGYPEK